MNDQACVGRETVLSMNDYYPLEPFRIHNAKTLCKIMRQWPLATLVSGKAGNARITLLPLIVEEAADGDLLLYGHLDVNNEHADAIEAGQPISFQFRGPDAYASPDLYPNAQLPGWLYVSVKGDGEVGAILTEEELTQLLCNSTTVFGSKEQLFKLSPDDERIGHFIGGIKGFVIKVTRIAGIAKLAQDKGRNLSHIATDYLLTSTDRSPKALFDLLLEETLSGE